MEQKNIDSQALIRKYFEEHSVVLADIDSFNYFVENELQVIVNENREIEPTIIPSNVEEFKIQLDKIWVTKPEITEADGSTRAIYPIEARLRNLSYAAPIYMEVSAHINGVQRESFKTQVGSLPIMLQSKNCHLAGLSKEELIKFGEDPDDPGGYFIINGTEKTIIDVEDLASNRFIVEKASTGVSPFVGKVFSEKGSYRIPHMFERLKDGIFYMTFTRVKRVPTIAVLKALGMTKDEEIMQAIGLPDNGEVILNLYEFVDVKTAEDAIDYMSKKIGINQAREIRIERMTEIVDKYLLPHIGDTEDMRMMKAHSLCKYLKRYVKCINGELALDDKDHYMNKRLKLSGDLLGDLFRVNLKVLIGDMLYNFQRIVKRGKFPSIKVIIREKLLTQKIYSSMATGNWVGGRTGVCQRLERLNFLQTLSHLQRVVSPLSSSQENFQARALHSTHMGRLCPSETPEGSNIGLRKNLAMLARASPATKEQDVLKELKRLGVQVAKEL
ncbi:MAG: DNA-directed RNA polymerase subunit B'' [Candidatus Woesearchaeota archaeon]|nr:DNA-directed RNA polymerase subunit B'' [Candidatus Woesearchaeota archaeon]